MAIDSYKTSQRNPECPAVTRCASGSFATAHAPFSNSQKSFRRPRVPAITTPAHALCHSIAPESLT